MVHRSSRPGPAGAAGLRRVLRGAQGPPAAAGRPAAPRGHQAAPQQHYLGALVTEAESMRELRHPHIVEVLGICNDWVVLELALLGELRAHLQTRAPERCDPRQLTSFCVQLADAIQYLHSKDLLHRDVACRNVLLMQPTVIKLADFGLSRKLAANEEYYKASGGKLPIKWLPPEAYNARKFTPASDVWMLAVCCWEIYSCGEKPWAGLSNVDAIRKVEARMQLAKPLLCPLAAYNLLCLCWTYEPRLRPTAEQFRARMAALTPEQLQVRNTATHNNNNSSVSNNNASTDYYSSATASPANAAATVSRPDSAGSLDDVFDRHSASPSPAAALAKAASATASVAPSAAPPKPPMPPPAAADSPAVSPVPKGVAAAAATAAALPAHEEAVVAAAVSLVRSLNSLVQAYVAAAPADPRQLVGHLRATGAELKSLHQLVESAPQLAGSVAVQRQCQGLTRDLAQLVRCFRAAQAAYAAREAAKFQALMREMLKCAAALGTAARSLVKAMR
ncbi:hypothetical protein BOX15_Mlig001027g2 [Macrostomum lignano]|uniref:Protein kinase domain-containing protein n=1 Tax=Macrostomum lignano TaxID=282301 RepID=A0A267FRR2_9PLAT|nr:hypothetical protein BOX15_Mlig001027g2 [Macrostomum lignano]